MRVFLMATWVGAAALVACSGEGDDGQGGADTQTFEQQAEAGAILYGHHCGHCHGASGEGTVEGPTLVGGDALPREPRDDQMRDVQFVTALDVFEWASTNMPPTAPGSLSDEQYLQVLAFALKANGVELAEPLTADVADQIVINP